MWLQKWNSLKKHGYVKKTIIGDFAVAYVIVCFTCAPTFQYLAFLLLFWCLKLNIPEITSVGWGPGTKVCGLSPQWMGADGRLGYIPHVVNVTFGNNKWFNGYIVLLCLILVIFDSSLYNVITFGITLYILVLWRGAESSLPVAHPGYQVLSDILFTLGLIANALTQCSA